MRTVTRTEVPGLWEARGPRGRELLGTELGQLEGTSHSVLSEFVLVPCDRGTSSDTKPCRPRDSLKLAL